MPETERKGFSLNFAELRLETYRASGAGGQNRNKRDTAVRVTHVPTGIIVTNADERTQRQNEKKALATMKARLSEIQDQQFHQEVNDLRNQGLSDERSFTWTQWRDEFKSSEGKKTSMKQALKGRFSKMLD